MTSPLAAVCRNSSTEMRLEMLWSTACCVNSNLPWEIFLRMASITNYISVLHEIYRIFICFSVVKLYQRA